MTVRKKFSMKTDQWELKIKEGSASSLVLELTFTDKELSETQLRQLEHAIRLLLQACGRLEPNPSKT